VCGRAGAPTYSGRVSGRAELIDEHGRPVLEYTAGTRAGRPWAHQVVVRDPAAVDRVLTELPGWMLTAPEDLGLALVARGATLRRHAHKMTLDLRGRSWPPVAPAGVRLVPCDRPAADLLAAHLTAYGPGHVDHGAMTPERAADELAGMLSGELVGALLGCSRLAVDGGGAVVGGCLVNDVAGTAFVTNVFRDPARSPAGTGTALLAAVLSAAAADGVERITLVVTEGNPARRTYDRLGFAVESTELSVVVPGDTP
jgi:ribosomal protein S18 acetylase RimI-like enzyme